MKDDTRKFHNTALLFFIVIALTITTYFASNLVQALTQKTEVSVEKVPSHFTMLPRAIQVNIGGTSMWWFKQADECNSAISEDIKVVDGKVVQNGYIVCIKELGTKGNDYPRKTLEIDIIQEEFIIPTN